MHKEKSLRFKGDQWVRVLKVIATKMKMTGEQASHLHSIYSKKMLLGKKEVLSTFGILLNRITDLTHCIENGIEPLLCSICRERVEQFKQENNFNV